jgi:hypothetical protein
MRTRRMIVRPLALLLLSGCSAAEGTVLHRKTPAEQPSSDASTNPPFDGSVSPPPPRDGGSQPGVGDCKILGGQGFVEQFTGPALDATRWLVAHGNEPMLGETSTGGFVRENVRIEDNKLVLTVRGDLYQGSSVRGFAADGTRRSDGKRTGAAIATRNLFQSATYQWEGRLSSEPGVKLVLAVRRAPVDESALAISAPGLDGATRSYGFVEALLAPGGAQEKRYQLRVATRLDDGNPQSLRFDWHSGGPGISHYYTDFQDGSGSLLNVQDPQPARAGRLWLAAFVPEGAPADFDTAEVRIETAFITPFAEGNDACTNGELPPGMLVAP